MGFHIARNTRRALDNTRLVIATLATGVVVGIGAIGFHFLSDRLGKFLFEWVELHEMLLPLPTVLVIPTVGLALIGVLLHFIPEGRFGGVVEVLDALKDSRGIIPFRRILNVILSGLVLAFGGSVGPEGPMVQLGALTGSLVAQGVRVAGQSLPLLVRAGVAAGIAAGFRSPAGGVMLAIELFGARFSQDLVLISIAAVIGYLTRTALLGDAFPFRPPIELHSLPLAGLFLIVPLMGLLAAPTGHIFISMFNRAKKLRPSRLSLAITVALGGFLVGVIGIWFPQVLSGGYPVIDLALRGGIGLSLLLALLGFKMLATSITFGSGAVGGLFAPTLVIGAMYGGAFGYGFHQVMPSLVPQPELFVLLGMVVMFGSIVKCYWSGLLMVADMSGCYHQLLLPGAIAGGISFALSWKLSDRSIFGLPRDPGLQIERSPQVMSDSAPEPTSR